MTLDLIHAARRWLTFSALLLFAVALGGHHASAQKAEDPPWEREGLIETLQGGGHILIIRHERTEVPSRRDDYTRAPDDCTAQRNLSVAGAAGAQETGVVLRALDIKVGRVITSPMCRSAETARYMFGVDYDTDARLMHSNPDGGRTLDVAEAELRTLLKELAPGLPESNIALVSHGGNIFRVSGFGLSEGEIGVLRLGADGEITAVDQFMGGDLAPFARRALSATK